MTQDQRNILIAVLAIILIAGGVYYYKNQPSADLVVEIPLSTPTTKSNEEQKTPVNTSPKDNTAISTVDNTAKFNTARFNLTMSNAQKAFVAGDYDKAIAFYNEALLYDQTDTPYSGLFWTYNAQNNIDKARVALESAIKINPRFTEYWIAKLTLLDEKTTLSFTDLKRIYQEGLIKVDPATKINLVTIFAGIAEKNGEKSEAIALWQYAIELYPQNKLIYQGEIDRIK